MNRMPNLKQMLAGWIALGYLGTVSAFLVIVADVYLSESTGSTSSKAIAVEVAILQLMLGGGLALTGTALRRSWSRFKASVFILTIVLLVVVLTVPLVGAWVFDWLDDAGAADLLGWSVFYLAIFVAACHTILLAASGPEK